MRHAPGGPTASHVTEWHSRFFSGISESCALTRSRPDGQGQRRAFREICPEYRQICSRHSGFDNRFTAEIPPGKYVRHDAEAGRGPGFAPVAHGELPDGLGCAKDDSPATTLGVRDTALDEGAVDARDALRPERLASLNADVEDIGASRRPRTVDEGVEQVDGPPRNHSVFLSPFLPLETRTIEDVFQPIAVAGRSHKLALRRREHSIGRRSLRAANVLLRHEIRDVRHPGVRQFPAAVDPILARALLGDGADA